MLKRTQIRPGSYRNKMGNSRKTTQSGQDSKSKKSKPSFNPILHSTGTQLIFSSHPTRLESEKGKEVVDITPTRPSSPSCIESGIARFDIKESSRDIEMEEPSTAALFFNSVTEVCETSDPYRTSLRICLEAKALDELDCCSLFLNSDRTMNLLKYHVSRTDRLDEFARVVCNCLNISKVDIDVLKEKSSEPIKNIMDFIVSRSVSPISYQFLMAVVRLTDKQLTVEKIVKVTHNWIAELDAVVRYYDRSILPAAPVEQKVASLSPKSLQEEYSICYQNFADVIVNGLSRKINERYLKLGVGIKALEERDVFAPLVHLTNCSGSGKTRAALELGKLTSVLYIKFGNNNGLESSKFGERMIKYLTGRRPSHRLEITFITNVLLQRLLFMCNKVIGVTSIGCLIPDEIISIYTTMTNTDGMELLFVDLDECVEVNSEYKSKYECEELIGFADPSTFKPLSFGMTLDQLQAYNAGWLKSCHEKLKDTNEAHRKLPIPSLPWLLVILDEAHVLMEEYNANSAFTVSNSTTKVDIYRLIRGCLRLFEFYWRNSLTITISTVAKLESFSPPENDPSFRKTNVSAILEHIILEHTFDSFRTVDFNEKTVQNWNDFLFSVERLYHISYCGRPLWGAHHGAALNSFFKGRLIAGSIRLNAVICRDGSYEPFCTFGESTFLEMWMKISSLVVKNVTHSQTLGLLHETVDVDDLFAYASLALSAALHKFPRDIDFSELVRTGPMALVKVDQKSRRIEAAACSEGNFNGASTILIMLNFEKVGRWLLSWIARTEKCLLSTGEIGELLDRIAILRAMYISGRQPTFERLELPFTRPLRTYSEFLFEPVGLEAFLEAYAGKEAAEEYLAVHKELVGSFLAFTHFITFSDGRFADAPFDIVADALSRGAAVVPPRGTPGVDTILPLVLRDGRMSFVYIQVKTGTIFNRLAYPSEVSDSCAENRLFKKHTRLDRSYCYIFRMQSDIPTFSHRVIQSEDHQPCLTLSGQLNVEGMEFSYRTCITWICRKQKKESTELPTNRSLNWRFKRESGADTNGATWDNRELLMDRIRKKEEDYGHNFSK